MFNIVLRNLSLLIDIFIFSYFFSSWSNDNKRQRNRYKFIWIGSIIFVMLASTFSSIYLVGNNLSYFNLVLSVLFIYSIAMLHSVPYLDSAVWTIAFISMNLIYEVLSIYLTRIIINTGTISYDNHKFAVVSILFTVIFELIGIIIIKFSIVKGNKGKLSTNLASTLFLILIPVLSVIVLFNLLTKNFNTNGNQTAEVSIVSGVIILNVCVVFLYKVSIEHQKEQYELSLNKKSIEAEHRVLNEMKKNRTNVLKLKHDLKNQYLTILGLIENNKLDEAVSYIKSSFDILEPAKKAYSSDGVLNYLLNEKVAEAEKNEIKVEHQLFLSKNININSDILAIVIGNLIDNAIQASDRIPVEDRYINIVIRQFKNDLFIEISNHFNPKEKASRLHRKEKGLGIKNINSLLNQIGGIYRHWAEENTYFVSVVVFNIYQKK